MAWFRYLTFPAVLVAAIVLLFVGSNSGIWDPWEMNKAHLAQQVAGQAKVLVADQDGAVLSSLKELESKLFLAGITPPEMPAVAQGRKLPEGPSQTVRTLKQVEARLDSEVFHAVVLDGSLLMADPTAAAATLDSIPQRAPGADVFVTAPKEGDCETLKQALDQGITLEAVASLKNTWKLWPADQQTDDLVEQHAGSYPFQVQITCTQAGEELNQLVSRVSSHAWTRVVYKGLSEPKSKETPSPALVTWSAPPLDYWLMAGSFKALGFSETGARLPGLLLALGTILLLFFVGRKLMADKEALMAVLALLSLPLFWGQSKNLMGENSYIFFLTLSVLLVAWMDQKGLSWKSLLLFGVAAVGLLFAKGLFGLLVLLVILGTLHLGMGEWKRTRTLIPLLGLAAFFGLMTLLVQFPTEWTFLDHFKLMSHGFLGGPQLELRTFDYLIRNVSFALLPMAVLVPFALFRMIPMEGDKAASDRSRLEVLTFLWFAIPFALQTALLPSFAQVQFPAVPAAALALALMWSKEENEGTNRFQAVVLLGIGMMLMANILKSPAPIFNMLTSDPHFAGEEGGTLKFPADYSMGTATNLLFLGVIALLFFYYIRGGDLYKTVVRFFQRPKPFFWALWMAMLAVIGRLAAGLASRFDMAVTGKNAGKLAVEDSVFVQELLGRRPETWMIYATAAVLAIVALWKYAGLGSCVTRFFRFLAKPASAAASMVVRFSDSLTGFGLAVGLALAALLDAVFTVPVAPEYWGSFVTRPLFLVSIALPVLVLVAAEVARRIRKFEWRLSVKMILTAVTLTLWLVAGSVFRQTDMTALDVPLLMMASFAILGLCWLPAALTDAARFRNVVLGVTALSGLAIVLPMLARWPGVEAKAFPNTDAPFLNYLFLESRTTFGVLGLLILVIVNRLFPPVSQKLRTCGTRNGTRPCLLDRIGMWNPAFWPEALQSRKVFLPILLTLGLGAGALFSVVVLPSFSREVSQKHILEIYYKSEAREDLGDNIFKYQKAGGGASEDLNFYTAALPELTGQNDLSKVLLASEDGLVKVTRSSSHPGSEYVLIRGFDPANDKDGDGNRDFAADAGVATSIEGTKVVDNSKTWAENQWKDKLFIDFKGNGIPVLANDATSLTLAQPVTGGLGNQESKRYGLDSPESANHVATALTKGRNYVVLGQEGFSNINFSFREQSDGRHIPVLDGSNASFLLATSYLLEGENNQNRFAQATMAKADLAKVKLKGGWINYNDQIKFLGYQIDTPQVGRNEKLTVRLYFEVLAKVDTSWKIFLHMDSVGSSNRIHGDHYPLSLSTDPEEKECVGCWRTNHWRPGDIIVDEFKTDIPLGTPGGQYTMNMGLYTPGSDKRLKVKEVQKGVNKHDGNDRVYIGSFEVN